MAHLAISLLGSMQITRDGHPVSGLTYAKAPALLAYLAVEADQPHQRESLAALLWPEQPEDKARHSLRQALATLRRAIGDHAAAPPYLLIARDTVGFNRASDHWLDFAALSSLLDDCDQHPHRRLETCPPCGRRLEHAVALYRGDFLTGFSIDDSATFEEWALLQRERLRNRILEALTALAAYQEQQGAYEAARRTARREVELDPWREQAHRRLMRLYDLCGERTAALAHFERLRSTLGDELGVEPEEETAALYAHLRTSRQGAPPAETRPGRSPRLHGFPDLPTPVIGRDGTLNQIGDLLTNANCRLLTLAGPGGIGKTRLAIQAAAEQAEVFADGAVFVPLAHVRAADYLVPAFADALGCSLGGHEDPTSQLLDHLRRREVLLVLDNFEHLLEGATVLAELLAGGSTITVLVTSRERLNLHGEWVYEVDGLDVPEGETADGASSIEDFGAVRLLVQRLRQVRPHSPLRAEERAAAARICRLVDGMPLAIELAAAWAPTLTLDEIAWEIEQSLDFLTTSMRDLPERHRSMRAVFDQSWNLLTAEESGAFRRLSVFRGGFRRAAAAEVAGASRHLLAALVSKSFIRQHLSGRYDIHELLRQYGDEQLRHDHCDAEQTHDRHAAYFLDFLARHEEALTGRGQQMAIAAISAEIENVRAAWRWVIERGQIGTITKAAHSLWLYYVVRGRMREGEAAFGDVVTSLKDGRKTADVSQAEYDLALGMALVRQGGYRSGLGRYEAARALLDEGIALLRRLDAQRELGLALNFLAASLHLTGAYKAEQAALRESLALLRASGDRWGAAYTLNDLGMVAHLLGNHNEARRLCHESLAIFERLGVRRGRGFALSGLGAIAADMGSLAEAARLHQAGLALRRSIGDQWGIAASLTQLGMVARVTGDHNRAGSYLLEALRTAQDGGLQPVVLDILVELGALARDQREPSEALRIVLPVVRHPACSQRTQEKAARLLTELSSTPPRWPITPMAARDSAGTIDELADALLRKAS